MRADEAEDERFVRRLVRRDEAAFSVLVERYQAMVLRCTRQVLGDAAEAEDAAQDAFVVIFKKIDSFRGESSLKTWVYRIARNTALNRARALSRRLPRATSTHENDAATWEETPASRRFDPVDHAERTELASSLREMVGRLDESYREVLVLRDVEELDYEEIAQILELPLGTVKSRIFRARAALRQWMGTSDES